jgi:hypothetical protein
MILLDWMAGSSFGMEYKSHIPIGDVHLPLKTTTGEPQQRY